MLTASLIREGQLVESQLVLNEAVITKGRIGSMIEIELLIDEDFVCRYRADGLIVATPTGQLLIRCPLVARLCIPRWSPSF